MEKEWREKGGGRGGSAAGRQSAIGGRQWPWGHVCRWEVYLCMEMMFDTCSSYCTGTAGPGGR